MCVWCVISKLIKVMNCYHVIDLFHVTLAHRNSWVPENKDIGLDIEFCWSSDQDCVLISNLFSNLKSDFLNEFLTKI